MAAGDISLAYCAETEVEAYTQQAHTATSQPTSTEVATFATGRSATVLGWIRDEIGDDSDTYPIGYPNAGVTGIDVTAAAGQHLDLAVRQASAKGAAVDAMESSMAGQEPSASDRVERLRIEFDGETEEQMSQLEKSVRLAARAFAGQDADRTETHLTSEMTPATVTTRQETGLLVTDETEW